MTTNPLDLDELHAIAQDQQGTTDPPPETDLGHIHLHVADLAIAERFYGEFLGLAVTQRAYPGAIFFSAGGYHHHLAVNTWAGKAPAPRNSVGLVSYRFEVFCQEVLYCLRNRAPLLGYDARIEPGDPTLLQIRDPNGNLLEIQSSPTPKKVDHRSHCRLTSKLAKMSLSPVRLG